jgi:hypothetical protein
VSALGIVKALNVIEHVGFSLIPHSVHLARDPLGLSEENKLSFAALSQTLPERLIEQMAPLSAISRWNCSLLYCRTADAGERPSCHFRSI